MRPRIEYIRSRRNPLVAGLRRLARAGRAKRAGRAIVEGLHPIEEAVAAEAGIEAVLVREDAFDAMAPRIDRLRAERLAVVPTEVMEAVATTTSPPPVLAAVTLPDAPVPEPLAGRGIVLDGVQDPGNVGAILRSAAGFGIDWALLPPDAADPFGPKGLRAAAGLVFRLRVEVQPRDRIARGLEAARAAGFPLLAAVAEGGRPCRDIAFPAEGALLVGGEGRGLTPDLEGLAAQRISIPTAPGVDSLNVAVAASILLAAWYAAIR